MKARYFTGITVILLGVVLLGLRYNNTTAYNMLMKIVELDSGGQDVTEEVEELRDFVFTHMVTAGPVEFTLEGNYERDVAEAQAEADASIDGSIYEQAAAACDREGQLTTENARCVQRYVEERLQGVSGEHPEIDKDAYSYTFESPAWTADMPGLALLGAVVSSLIAVVLYARYHLANLMRKNTRSK